LGHCFSQGLGEAVNILGIALVTDSVPASTPGENAIAAGVDQALLRPHPRAEVEGE
jgi:hypothetical protein